MSIGRAENVRWVWSDVGDPRDGECPCSVTTDFTARGSDGNSISTVPAS